MGRRDKELLANVMIETIAAEGKAIAHVNGKVLFIPYAIPGDIVDVQVKIKRKGYMEGYITRMVEPSADRIEPFCSHFGLCGGCKWQILPYPFQLKFKQQQVIDQLTRIGHLELPEISPILGSGREVAYRNKLEYTFSSKRWIESGVEAENLSPAERVGLGFHISGLFDKVLDIQKCYLQHDLSNRIRLFVKRYAIENNLPFFDLREQTGLMRNIIIRNTSTGEWMVTVVFAGDEHFRTDSSSSASVPDNDSTLLLNAIAAEFPGVRSLNYIINSKKNDSIADLECLNYSGSDAIYEVMEGLKFRIGPKSFYQTNSEQAYKLYGVVRDFASLSGNEILYDLYTGTGTIALFLASQAKKVIGIEYVSEAIEDAIINACNNNIINTSFYAGDMKDILTDSFIEENGKPDVIVLDPPRAGIHPDVAKVILRSSPAKIVYVSCNPASQARDIALMKEYYTIEKVQPVDMFPHTHHVENVVLLKRRDIE